MQASKQRTLRRRSVVTAPEVIRPLVHTTDEWWLACKETSPSIPSPTWRTTFLHLLGEQHSFTYLENNIPSPHLGLAWTGPRPRPRPRPRTGPGPRPGPGLHMDLDYTWTWTWTWTSPGHQRFLQIRCLLRFLLQLHLLHLDLLLLSLPRPVIKLVQLQVSWPSEREQRGPILTPTKSIDSRCRMSSNLDTWNPETPLSSDSS